MKKPPGAAPASLAGGSVVGSIQLLPIDSIRPNGWNPNRMTPDTFASLKYGLLHDGWLASQALLVWGTDDDGDEQGTIIDGEHRWRVAKELGTFPNAPCVVLKGISMAKAKALTVAMNQKRGEFDQAGLEKLLQDIQFDVPDLALNLGIETEDLMKMLASVATPDLDLPDVKGGVPLGINPFGGATAVSAESTTSVRMVQLYLDEAKLDEFNKACRVLSTRYGTANTTDTIMETVRRAATAPLEGS